MACTLSNYAQQPLQMRFTVRSSFWFSALTLASLSGSDVIVGHFHLYLHALRPRPVAWLVHRQLRAL